MLCKCHWIVLYTVHFTAFCLGGPFFSGHDVCISTVFFERHARMVRAFYIRYAYT